MDPALANDCVSVREFSINEAVNFPKIHRINQGKGPGYPEMSSEIIPKSTISFMSAKFMQIPGVLIATGNQRNDVLNLLGKTATLTPEVEIESCPDYPRAFPF